MIDLVEQKLMDRISEVEEQLSTLNRDMAENANDQRILYNLRTIYTGLNKNLTELLRYLTSIQIAKLNDADSTPSNPDVVFKGSREQLLAELKQKKLDNENTEMRERYANG
jgi:hypothetical protein